MSHSCTEVRRRFQMCCMDHTWIQLWMTCGALIFSVARSGCHGRHVIAVALDDLTWPKLWRQSAFSPMLLLYFGIADGRNGIKSHTGVLSVVVCLDDSRLAMSESGPTCPPPPHRLRLRLEGHALTWCVTLQFGPGT